jgi:hypothetical protein
MFNFFRGKKPAVLPDRYEGLINQKDYTYLIALCKDYLAKDGQQIKNIDDGEIIVKQDHELEKHYYLDNIVRIISQNQKSDWQAIVTEHFDKQKEIPFAIDYLYSDFGYASQFIKAYIKPKDFFPPDEVNEFVYRTDLPDTYTFLIFDFNEQFHFITKDGIKDWKQSEADLFEIGLSNISNESITIEEILIAGKYPAFAFFSGDFSATYIVELQKNASFAIGTHGSLISIPAKGCAFVYPIENNEIVDVVNQLAETTEKFYNEEPGNLSMDFFWNYDGKFEMFPSVRNGDALTIECPPELKRKINIH